MGRRRSPRRSPPSERDNSRVSTPQTTAFVLILEPPEFNQRLGRQKKMTAASAILSSFELEEERAARALVPIDAGSSSKAKICELVRHELEVGSLHFLGCISPIFPPFFPVFCAFSPPRRDGSNEPQAGTQGQETASKRTKRGELPPSFDAPGAYQRITWRLFSQQSLS